jgi:hypothetical protein
MFSSLIIAAGRGREALRAASPGPKPVLSNQPGWRRPSVEVRREAGLRGRLLAEVRRAPGSCEELAGRLEAPLLSVRPRCSELRAQGRIADSGRRGRSARGHEVIVWRAVER